MQIEHRTSVNRADGGFACIGVGGDGDGEGFAFERDGGGGGLVELAVDAEDELVVAVEVVGVDGDAGEAASCAGVVVDEVGAFGEWVGDGCGGVGGGGDVVGVVGVVEDEHAEVVAVGDGFDLCEGEVGCEHGGGALELGAGGVAEHGDGECGGDGHDDDDGHHLDECEPGGGGLGSWVVLRVGFHLYGSSA